MAEAVTQSRWRDLEKLLQRPGNLVSQNFEASTELLDDLQAFVKVLVVGAGGLGCELLKDLALSGFRNIDVIDMDRIEISNLNRQFLFRLQDVGKPKAEVAAMRVMERVGGVNIVPHFSRIEDKELEFYSDFNIIALGLDSIEARSYINGVACSFLEFSKLNPLNYVPVLVDEDIVIVDSFAILLYLDEKYPQHPLLPHDLQEKAINIQAANIVCSSIQPLQNLAVLKFIEEKIGSDERVAWAQFHIGKGFAALEKLLSGFAGRYATGDEVFLANLFLAPQINAAITRFKLDIL